MRKISVLLGVLLAFFTLTAMGIAVISSYGSITGYAIVEESIVIDIIGSSNDENYTMSAYQGETLYSPKIKLKNSADAEVDVIVNVSTDHPDDVAIYLVDESKNITLTNPIAVPADDFYFYIRKDFDAAASPGNYSFNIDVLPY